MRTTTIIAASAAILGSVNAASHVQMMGQALERRDWKDSNNVPTAPVEGGEDKPTKPVDGGEDKPTKPVDGGHSAPTKPVDGGEDKPTKPVDGGEDKPTKPVDGGESHPTKPVDGGEGPSKPVLGGEGPTKPVDGGEDKPTKPVDGGEGHPTKPVDGGEGPSKPVLGGEATPSTTTTAYYWGDAPEVPSSTPSKPVDGGNGGPSKPVLGGEGHPTKPVDGGEGPSKPVLGGEATPSTTTTAHYWGDAPEVPSSTPSKPVDGGFGGPSKPVLGGEGKPSKPVDGGEGAPSKPVLGGEGQPTGAWGDVPSEDDEETVTITKTTTHTVTKYIEGEAPKTWADVPADETPAVNTWADAEVPSSETAPHNTWEDVPSVETDAPNTWADVEVPSSETAVPSSWVDVEVPSSAVEEPHNTWVDAGNWASSVPAGAGVDECIITVITKYGKPTWHPTPAVPAETPAVNTWADAPEVPASQVPEEPHNTWEDVPSVETTTAADHTWEDVPSVETTTPVADHTWEDVPSVETTTPVADHTWEDVPSVETTTAADHTWEDVPSVETTTAADHTWEDVPSVETTTAADHTWEDVPSVETTTEAAHTWEDVPSVETTTTTAVEAVHTWGDAAIPSQSGDSGYGSDAGSDDEYVSGGNGNGNGNGYNSGSGSGSSNTGLGSSDSKWAVTYSPYRDDSGCKSQGTIESEIAEIAGKQFTAVRVYATDCNTLEYVGGAAKNNGIKLILGVFISETGIEGAKSQVSDIIQWAQWDLVELIIVGNEAVFNGRASASDLKAFIISSKSAFQGAGYNGPVSTTETLAEWESDGASWCDAVDVVTANLYAFFNKETVAENAGKLITDQLEVLKGICPGKEVYITECGWPTQGQANGKAIPGVQQQKTAVESIKASGAGANIVWFSWFNEGFKPLGPLGVEQSWGLRDSGSF